MKSKLLTIVVLLSMVMSIIVGCSKTNTSEETTTEAAKEPVTINVFVAASLKNAMQEIQTEFVKDNENVSIVFNADSSGTLQTQIQEGAACDVFFSAATKQMTALSDTGLIKKDSVVNLLENKVVLIKAKGATTKVTGFENISDASNLALAGEEVPVGAYARTIFKNLGIYDAVMSMEINQGANVTAVLTAVSEGSNEVGVVYATDAASMPDSVEVIAEAPASSLGEPVIYPVGLVENANASDAQQEAAADFVAFLQTDTAKAIFEEYGFSIAE